jgi:Tol biopolymer transport system component
MAAVEVLDSGRESMDLWLLELDSELMTRFTFNASAERNAIWSPNSDFLYYSAEADSVFQVLRSPIEGQGRAEVLVEAKWPVRPTSMSPDGSVLLVEYLGEKSSYYIAKIALDAAEYEMVTLMTNGEKLVGGGRFSPDGRWVAFHSQSESSWDVFVVAAEGGERKWQVSHEGTVYPRWSADGSELWTLAFDGDLNKYSVDGSGATFHIGGMTQTLTVLSPDAEGPHYARHPDDLRLITSGAGESPASIASILLHYVNDWQRGLVR